MGWTYIEENIIVEQQERINTLCTWTGRRVTEQGRQIGPFFNFMFESWNYYELIGPFFWADFYIHNINLERYSNWVVTAIPTKIISDPKKLPHQS
jgi:hypothetical protein